MFGQIRNSGKKARPVKLTVYRGNPEKISDPTEDMEIVRNRELSEDTPDPSEGMIPSRRPGSGYTQPIEVGLEETRQAALANLTEKTGEYIPADRVNSIPAVPENWESIIISIRKLTPKQSQKFFWDLDAYIPQRDFSIEHYTEDHIIKISPRNGAHEEASTIRDRLQNFVNLLSQHSYYDEDIELKVNVKKV